MSSYGLIAKLVWDGSDEVRIPSELGKPAESQMKGTFMERLSELAGRSCYDSLGKGRSSAEYHAHILEVKHTSVYGHGAVTIKLGVPIDPRAYINRPGVWVEFPEEDDGTHRVTLNPRAMFEWDSWTRSYRNKKQIEAANFAKKCLQFYMHDICPNVVPFLQLDGPLINKLLQSSSIVAPVSEEEMWVSLFLSGSRGFSHEQVRHGFRTGISQRSTRYVDENESPWIHHPLVREYLQDPDMDPEASEETKGLVEQAKHVYRGWVERLQPWLIGRGVDKFTARKQARGAARGYLGNALQTELIFSASVAQWKRILRQRLNDHADAEICAIMAAALPELQASRYGYSFKAFRLVPAKHGIGHSAVEETGGSDE